MKGPVQELLLLLGRNAYIYIYLPLQQSVPISTIQWSEARQHAVFSAKSKSIKVC